MTVKCSDSELTRGFSVDGSGDIFRVIRSPDVIRDEF